MAALGLARPRARGEPRRARAEIQNDIALEGICGVAVQAGATTSEPISGMGHLLEPLSAYRDRPTVGLIEPAGDFPLGFNDPAVQRLH